MAEQAAPHHGFDKDYWEQHWQRAQADGAGSMGASPANPHLVREISGLTPGTALDAGCGAGAEAIWLASRGWQVTAADLSTKALAQAAAHAATSRASERVQWVEADLSSWDPGTRFDLVTTHYAHPAMPQLEFYDRIAEWVAPGGTLLIVGHLHTHTATADDHDDEHGHDEHGGGHRHHPPAEAWATAATITARLDETEWTVVTAEERHRTLAGPGGREIPIHDVVVLATRRE